MIKYCINIVFENSIPGFIAQVNHKFSYRIFIKFSSSLNVTNLTLWDIIM
jgi:hypothetical protein